MFNHLNIRTKQEIEKLLSGGTVSIGGGKLNPLDENQARFLYVLSVNIQSLKGQTGRELGDRVFELFFKWKDEEIKIEGNGPITTKEKFKWRIESLRACSFRGLAPSGKTWEFEFNGDSHLIYGPNGCGKSSLLGAISWCLTGKIFRDDIPPAVPQDQAVFTLEDNPKNAGKRPDALAVFDEKGNDTPKENEYWVEIKFNINTSSDESKKLWVRRRSVDGLSFGTDGEFWTPIKSLDEAGINELDAELLIILPARIAHLKFGEDPDIMRLFSQIVGLDELEEISGLAGKTHTALVKERNRIEKDDLTKLEVKIGNLKDEIEKQQASAPIKNLVFHQPALLELVDIENFDKELARLIDESNNELATDLNIQIPEEDAPEFDSFKEKMTYLPGQVHSALAELEKPLKKFFFKSLGLEIPTRDEMNVLKEKLTNFESEAKVKIRDRLNWLIREEKEKKLQLMLKAAEHFPEGENTCPVCIQSLIPVPKIKIQLEELRPYVTQKFLEKPLDDFKRELLESLNGIVAKEKSVEGKTLLSERLKEDWNALRQRQFPDPLVSIAHKLDSEIESLCGKVEARVDVMVQLLAEEHEHKFESEFKEIKEALGLAKAYFDLVDVIHANSEEVKTTLGKIVKPITGGGSSNSLSEVLGRGRSNSEKIRIFKDVQKSIQKLYELKKEWADIRSKLDKFSRIAEASMPTKELGGFVQEEMIRVVKRIAPTMKKHFSQLYDNDLFAFDRLTPGHAANQNIRKELSAYLKSRDELLPIGPFSNAGRLRALALSFVFSLMDSSFGSLGFLILDDPAMSLDDDHQARFVDKLVAPKMNETQVILATHYEEFYKDAEIHFKSHRRIKLSPRRSPSDAVMPEPADLLIEVKNSLNKQNESWRTTGINLRRFAERSLHTISGYCPEPFVEFNNIPASVDAYAAIKNPEIATGSRDKIVSCLRSPEFERVRNALAHDDRSPSKSEVEDAFKVLSDCRKIIDSEIERFKKLYNHDLLDRSIEAKPNLVMFPKKDSNFKMQLKIVGQAAASSNGVGVIFEEHVEIPISNYQVGLVKLNTISPIAWIGQYLLLDPEDNPLNNADLVVIETEKKQRYLRRYWAKDGFVNLEAVNSTHPIPPVEIRSGDYLGRRVFGVFFDGPTNCGEDKIGAEWVPVEEIPSKQLIGVTGIRVDGSSLEPIARHGQIALIRHDSDLTKVQSGILACVDIQDIGAVIKRCYPKGDELILCPVNVGEEREPIRVKWSEVLKVHPLVGILFEHTQEE